MIDRRARVMRRKSAWISTFQAGAYLCCASLLPLSAAQAATAPHVIVETARTVAGGRAVEATVGQAEIASRITSTSAATGFMVGGLLGAAIDSSRAKGHEDVITSVRDSLLDFDTDGLAIKTTQDALAGIDWLQPADIKFSKDSSLFEKNDVLDNGGASQAAFFDYYYELVPDFTAVRVVLSIQFVNKAPPEGKKTDARFKPGNLAYAQTITSVVSLPQPGPDIHANAELWSADNGKLARAALTQAFGNAEKATAHALILGESDYKALKDQGGFPLDPEDPAGVRATPAGGGFTITSTLPKNP